MMDFAEFTLAQQIKTDARNQLAHTLQLVTNEIDDNGVHIILLRCMRYEGYSATIQKEIETYFKHACFCIIQDDYRPLTCENIMFGNALIHDTLLQDPQVLSDIESNH